MEKEQPFFNEYPPIKKGAIPESGISVDEADLVSDEASDTAIVEEITERKEMMSATERLEIIRNLRGKAGMDTGGFTARQFLEYKESNPSPYGVTLGIEIEIPEESVLPTGSKNWGREKKDEFLNEARKKYEETEKIGVPRDTDQFWEFANLPAHNPETLAREVEALIGMELIDKKYAKFPLHVTIGGITFTHCPAKKREDALVLIRAMDATGWCTDGDRLTRLYHDKESNWMAKSKSGILERDTNENFLADKNRQIKTALEFRTPQLQSLPGLGRYLHSVYYLGSALRAYQNTDEKDQISKNLSKTWEKFSKECMIIFEKYGLESPRKWWEIDFLNPNEDSPFKDLAKLLDKSKNNPNSRKAQFVHDIRLLIIQARGKVKEIIEEDRKKRGSRKNNFIKT